MVKVRCPNGHELSVPEEYLGKKGRCKHCQTVFVIRKTEEGEEYSLRREPIAESGNRGGGPSDPGPSQDSEGERVPRKKRKKGAGSREKAEHRKRAWWDWKLSPVWRLGLFLVGLGIAVTITVPMLIDINDSLNMMEPQSVDRSKWTLWGLVFGNEEKPKKETPLDVVASRPKIPLAPQPAIPESPAGDKLKEGVKEVEKNGIDVITLPQAYTDYAMNPETGDLVCVGSHSKEVHIYPRVRLEEGKIVPTKALQGDGRVLCVSFKQYGDRNYLAVGRETGPLQICDAKTLEELHRLEGDATYVAELASSTDPNDPLLFFRTMRNGIGELGVITLQERINLGIVTSAMPGIAVSPSGREVYVLKPGEGKAHCLTFRPEGEGKLPSLLNDQEVREFAWPFHFDPTGKFCVGDRTLFESELKMKVGELPFRPQCFLKGRRVFLGGSSFAGFLPAGEVGVDLRAVSMHTYREVGIPVMFGLKYQAEQSSRGRLGQARRGDTDSAQANSEFDWKRRLIPDEPRGKILFTLRNKVVLIPVSAFQLPDESGLELNLEIPERIVAGKEQRLRLKAGDSGEIQLEAAPNSKGMRKGDSGELFWTPGLDQVGANSLELVCKMGEISRKILQRVEVEYPRKEFTTAIRSVHLTPDENRILIVGGGAVAADGGKGGGNIAGELSVLDLNRGGMMAGLQTQGEFEQALVNDEVALVWTRGKTSGAKVLAYRLKDLTVVHAFPEQESISFEGFLWPEIGVFDRGKSYDLYDLKSFARKESIPKIWGGGGSADELSRETIGPIFNLVQHDALGKPLWLVGIPVEIPALQTIQKEAWTVQRGDPRQLTGSLVEGVEGAYPWKWEVKHPHSKVEITLRSIPDAVAGVPSREELILEANDGVSSVHQSLGFLETQEVRSQPGGKGVNLTAGGGKVYVSIGRYLYVWDLPQKPPRMSEMTKIVPEGTALVVDGRTPTKIKHRVEGLEGKKTYELLISVKGVSLDSESGEITIGGPEMVEEAATALELLIRKRGEGQATDPKLMDAVRAKPMEAAKQLLGKVPEGFPFAMLLRVSVANEKGLKAGRNYWMICTIPEADLLKSLTERQSLKKESERQKPEAGEKEKSPQELESEKQFPKEDADPSKTQTPSEANKSAKVSERAGRSVWFKEEQEIHAAIEEAVRLLDKNDYEAYAHRYMPINQFREIRVLMGTDQGYSAIVEAVNGKGGVPFVELLKNFQGGKIKIIEGGEAAQIFPVEARAKVSAPEGEVSANGAIPEAEREIRIPELKLPALTADEGGNSQQGYGGDLLAAIGRGIQSLEEGKYEEFVDNMYPLGELARLQERGGRERLLERLKKDGPLVLAMVQDLKRCQTAVLTYDRNNQEATILIRGSGTVQNESKEGVTMSYPRGRAIMFQLVRGNWRFFDETSVAYKKIQSELKRSPVEIAAKLPTEKKPEKIPSQVLQMEKIGDEWRIQSLTKP